MKIFMVSIHNKAKKTHRVSYSFAEKCVRYNLPKLVNDTSSLVFDKLFTHSLDGFEN